MTISAGFITHIGEKIKGQGIIKEFLESSNSTVKYPTLYQFSKNGENLRVIEVVFPNVFQMMENIEISPISIYGPVSDEMKQTIADFGPTCCEMIGKTDF